MDREIIEAAQRTYAANLVEHGNFAAMELAITGALSRLSVSPLPEEIAKLIEQLRREVDLPLPHFQAEALHSAICEKAAAALEQMAREATARADVIRHYRDRAHGAEAERDRCRETNTLLMGQWEDACRERDEALKLQKFLQAAHDGQVEDKETIAGWLAAAHKEMGAIKAKTINEILSLIPGGNICDPQKIADSIRALMPAGDGKEET